MDVSVLGCGPWGQNIIRTLRSLEPQYSFNLSSVVHTGDPERAEAVRELVSLEPSSDVERVLQSSDAVAVATPDDTHPQFVKRALDERCHVFVEKPIAFDWDTAETLFERAESNSLVLTVGHLMMYHPAIQFIGDRLVDHRDSTVFSHRFNNLRSGGGRRLLHSSFIHDLSVLDGWFQSRPGSITLHETSGSTDGLDYVSGTLGWDDSATVHFQCGRKWPSRRRSIAVRTAGSFYHFDGIEDVLRIYDQPDERHAEGVTRTFDRLPLTVELEQFIEAIQKDRRPLVGRDHVRRVTETIEQIENRVNGR